ncbi:hypothetical protein BDR03DRAFT_948125 [Suillus americanus]|nr:hypothetical protein BDR03DRAFT_948125 [Suillus americanus]
MNHSEQMKMLNIVSSFGGLVRLSSFLGVGPSQHPNKYPRHASHLFLPCSHPLVRTRVKVLPYLRIRHNERNSYLFAKILALAAFLKINALMSISATIEMCQPSRTHHFMITVANLSQSISDKNSMLIAWTCKPLLKTQYVAEFL